MSDTHGFGQYAEATLPGLKRSADAGLIEQHGSTKVWVDQDRVWANIRGLWLCESGRTFPLPVWAAFFAGAGTFVADQPEDNLRTVVALALPTRGYAAAFAALGVVTARALAHDVMPDAEEHFHSLCKLPAGTMLLYMKKDRQLRARFDGVGRANGQPVIRVQIQNRKSDSRSETGMTELLTAQQALRIEIAKGASRQLTNRKGGAGRKVEGKGLLEAFLGNRSVDSFVIRSRLECALIGIRNVLQHEICEIQITIQGENGPLQTGCLQDVIRVRDFLDESEAYWSDFFPARGSTPAKPDGPIPSVTIFDGATGFLKWRDYWRSSNWLVLLDRTDYQFEEAVHEVNQEYRQNRVGKVDAKSFPAIPGGIEAVVYQERKK